MEFGIERARSLYNSTQNIRYSSMPSIDLKDRLSAATVAAGLRSVGVLEGEGLQLELVRESLINQGIYTLISKSVCDKTRVSLNPSRCNLLPEPDRISAYHREAAALQDVINTGSPPAN
jgi:hypothetical protein